MLFNIISISLGAILINNFIFSQFLGCSCNLSSN